MNDADDIPVRGQVVGYRYLWARDKAMGLRPVESRPCLILQAARLSRNRYEVLVLPITSHPNDIRILRIIPETPVAGFIDYSEANALVWPSPDVVHVKTRDERFEPRTRLSDLMLDAADAAFRAERMARKAIVIERDEDLRNYVARREERGRQR